MPDISVEIVPFEPAHRAACEAILAGLSEWFGFAAANEAYIAALNRLPAFVALVNAAVAGFIAIEEHTTESAEVHVLAVTRERRRQGIGGRLLAHAEDWLRLCGIELLHVKTLGPSDPDANYARTRAFYAAQGFRPLFESTAFWGESQPALVMLKLL